MSILSSMFQSGKPTSFNSVQATRRHELDDGHSLGLLNNSRRQRMGKGYRTILWTLALTTLMFSMFYVSGGTVKLVHLSTAAKCHWAMRYPHHGNFTNASHIDTDEAEWARVMLPSDLMERLDYGMLSGSKILHQSWGNYHLPERFAKWSEQWRKLHGSDWTWVLWTDVDNRKLVERYYPQFLDTYNALPREIYRADMARNMYMHLFGGIYADLDLVPLSPVHQHLPILSASSPPPIHFAYVGHMSGDDFEHSIPNAFMASIPAGHPFWLKPLHFVQENLNSETHKYPEALTGPVALKSCVKAWEMEKEARLADNIFDELTVLENGRIYPFSWWDSPFTDQCICRPQSAYFDPAFCNSLYPEAWTITYWSHSWEDYSW